MKIDKKMIERAKILEGKLKPVEWADDFLTVEEMLKEGISWKTIQILLSQKYKKPFKINGLARDFRVYHTDLKGLVLSAPVESSVGNEPVQAAMSPNDLARGSDLV